MNGSPPIDPRWGHTKRDVKACAILKTLELHFCKPMKVLTWLDVGCGSGGIAAELAGSVDRIIGADPEAWKRWQDFETTHPNLKFYVAKYDDLPRLFPHKEIDVIVCNQVYEHVDDPAKLLAAIATVLNDNGVCYFAGPNLLWPVEPHVFWPLVHWLPRSAAQKIMRLCGSKKAQELDAYSWGYWRLTRAFRAAGFSYSSVIRERLIAGVADKSVRLKQLFEIVPRRLYRLLSPFAPGFVFVLAKRHPPDLA